MTDEIRPALTLEEWERIASDSEYFQPSTIEDLRVLDESDLPRAVAYANNLLPDDSLYKITRADVEMLRAAAAAAGDATDFGFMEGLEQFAVKLGALLPPE